MWQMPEMTTEISQEGKSSFQLTSITSGKTSQESFWAGLEG